MKQLSFSALLLFVVLITGSCKKIPVMNIANATISFKMDGVFKEAKGNKNVFALYSKEQEFIQIIGNLSGDQSIGITIADFHGVGEYTVADEQFLGSFNTSEDELTIIGTEGKVKITEFIEGKSIKGEFQFKGQTITIRIGDGDDPDEQPVEIRTFSEGKFDVKVTSYSGPLVEPG